MVAAEFCGRTSAFEAPNGRAYRCVSRVLAAWADEEISSANSAARGAR